MSRRFQVVKVDEPDEEKCLLMIRGLASVMEKHFKVQVLDEALESAGQAQQALHPGAASSPTRPSASSTPPAPAWPSACTPSPPRSTTRRSRIDGHEHRAGHRRPRDRHRQRPHQRRAELVHELQAEDEAAQGSARITYNKEKAVVEKILDLRGKLRAAPTSPSTRARRPRDAPATRASSDAKPPAQMEPKLSEDEAASSAWRNSRSCTAQLADDAGRELR